MVAKKNITQDWPKTGQSLSSTTLKVVSEDVPPASSSKSTKKKESEKSPEKEGRKRRRSPRCRDIRRMVEGEVGKRPQDLEDRLMLEIAGEIDHLYDAERAILKNEKNRPEAAATVSFRRLTAIKSLEDAIKRKRERGGDQYLELLSEVVMILNQTLSEMGQTEDEIELITQTLVPKLEHLLDSG